MGHPWICEANGQQRAETERPREKKQKGRDPQVVSIGRNRTETVQAGYGEWIQRTRKACITQKW